MKIRSTNYGNEILIRKRKTKTEYNLRKRRFSELSKDEHFTNEILVMILKKKENERRQRVRKICIIYIYIYKKMINKAKKKKQGNKL